MPTTITGDPTAALATSLTVPSDGDTASASSIDPAFQQLADEAAVALSGQTKMASRDLVNNDVIGFTAEGGATIVGTAFAYGGSGAITVVLHTPTTSRYVEIIVISVNLLVNPVGNITVKQVDGTTTMKVITNGKYARFAYLGGYWVVLSGNEVS
jgi:hypothetical protein